MYELRSSADEPYIVILGSLAGKTVRQGFVFDVFRILLEAHLVLRLDLDFHDVCEAPIWKCEPLRVLGKIRICSVLWDLFKITLILYFVQITCSLRYDVHT
jgi:hypothetical protein